MGQSLQANDQAQQSAAVGPALPALPGPRRAVLQAFGAPPGRMDFKEAPGTVSHLHLRFPLLIAAKAAEGAQSVRAGEEVNHHGSRQIQGQEAHQGAIEQLEERQPVDKTADVPAKLRVRHAKGNRVHGLQDHKPDVAGLAPNDQAENRGGGQRFQAAPLLAAAGKGRPQVGEAEQKGDAEYAQSDQPLP